MKPLDPVIARFVYTHLSNFGYRSEEHGPIFVLPAEARNATSEQFRQWVTAGQSFWPRFRTQGLQLFAHDLTLIVLDKGILRDAVFDCCTLAGASFNSAELPQASFWMADLEDAVFLGANLSDANFKEVNAKGAQFGGATLIRAEFTGADLEGASFAHANTEGACFDGTLNLDKVLNPTPEIVQALNRQQYGGGR